MDDLLIKVQAVDAGDAQAVLAAIQERMEWARAKLARYDRLRDRLLGGRTEDEFLTDSDRIGPYLTLMRGRSLEQETISWCERVLAILTSRLAGETVENPLAPGTLVDLGRSSDAPVSSPGPSPVDQE